MREALYSFIKEMCLRYSSWRECEYIWIEKAYSKKRRMKQTIKFGESSKRHITNLNSFFLCDCLAQAEEPGLIPVFPLHSAFVVYVTSTSNILFSEITSALVCFHNPQVAKEYFQSRKPSYPATGSAWLGCTLELGLCPQQRKGSSFLSEYSGLLNHFILVKHMLKQ